MKNYTMISRIRINFTMLNFVDLVESKKKFFCRLNRSFMTLTSYKEKYFFHFHPLWK
jgi:hypothetical protein